MVPNTLTPLILAICVVARAAAAQPVPPSPTESIRAAQNALRNLSERTVNVPIGPGPVVPVEVGRSETPLLVADDERLVLQNSSNGTVLIRFLDDAGAVNENRSIRVIADGDASVPAAGLLRLAGTDRRLTIQIISQDGPAALPAVIEILLAGAIADVAEERAQSAAIAAAQEKLVRTPAELVTPPPPPPPPGTAKPPAAPTPKPTIQAPSVELKIGLRESPEATATQPLPLERIRIEGQLVGEDLKLTNTSGEPLIVVFLDEDGAVRPASRRPIAANATTLYTYDTLDGWVNEDHDLAFEVRDAAGKTLWSGHLTTDVSLLESGRIFVPIDLTGVSDWRFVNPRRPVRIGPQRTDVEPATLEFANRVPGRTIKVTFPPIPRTQQKNFEDAGFEVNCNRPKTCSADLVLQAANRSVKAELLVDAYGGTDSEGLVTFNVAFFEGDIEPANAVGYIAVVKRPFEPAFSASWNAVANAGLLRDADFAGFTIDDNEAPVINTTTPFDGGTRWHLTGQVRLSARPQLGTRANAEIDLVVKDKDYGIADSPTVTAQKFRVNVFGYNGFSLSVGRFDFAAPTRSIAIAESGEGFSGRWRRFTISHIIRSRERLDKGVIPVEKGQPALFPISPDLRDRFSTLAQAQWAPAWLRMELSALTGRRKTLKDSDGRRYVTAGGDVIAANGFGKKTENPKAVWRLNGGLYGSRREARDGVDAGDSGWTGLVDGSVALLEKEKRNARWTFGGTLARASRDDVSTPQDEGYIGESAAFGPDRIFLATLAGKVATLTTAVPDEGGEDRKIRGGLTGKDYVGLGAIFQGYSPLRHLAVGVPTSDVNAQSMTFRWQGYSLRNPVTTPTGGTAKSWLGHELSLECLLESPRGVRYALTGVHFTPGDLLRDQGLIRTSTWLIDARVTVTLK